MYYEEDKYSPGVYNVSNDRDYPYIGFLVQLNGVGPYTFTALNWLGADEMRDIADKLDELNGVTKESSNG